VEHAEAQVTEQMPWRKAFREEAAGLGMQMQIEDGVDWGANAELEKMLEDAMAAGMDTDTKNLRADAVPNFFKVKGSKWHLQEGGTEGSPIPFCRSSAFVASAHFLVSNEEMPLEGEWCKWCVSAIPSVRLEDIRNWLDASTQPRAPCGAR
jgi:hypothetical protein